jgi:hypothetical protein
MITVSSNLAQCTIIIPTRAAANRADALRRAIRSLCPGGSIKPRIVVVVNGNKYCQNLLEELKESPEVELIQIAAPSLPEAHFAGRRAVNTPFFGFLDDDDEYLPGAIETRLAVMDANPEISLVVTNGYRHVQGQDHPVMTNLANVPRDPLYALFQENWLASCGGLFRARDVSVDTFAGVPHFQQWTWVAFRLSVEGKIKVASLETPTFRIHDTPGSNSKSEEFLFSQVELYQRMLSMSPRPDIARIIRRRILKSWHDVSNHHLKKGTLGPAWTSHLKSLSHPAGWVYLPYTYRLLTFKAGNHA